MKGHNQESVKTSILFATEKIMIQKIKGFRAKTLRREDSSGTTTNFPIKGLRSKRRTFLYRLR